MFQPLSWLITSQHSLFLPSSTLLRVLLWLPLAYYRYRPPIDSVGFTLLCRLVVCSRLGTIYSAVRVVFTRFIKVEVINLLTYLLVEASKPYSASYPVTQFKQ